MKVSELYETPQSIPGLNQDELTKEIQACLKQVNSAKEIKKINTRVTLYELTKGNNGYYFAYDSTKTGNDRIIYFVKYSTVEFNPKVIPRKAIRQVLVWRNARATLAGVAKEVFWDILFPKYKCLASDSQQTDAGKQFWVNAVGYALKNGLTVRIINTNDNTFDDVTTTEQFDDLEPTTWGTSSWFQRKIVVIYTNEH